MMRSLLCVGVPRDAVIDFPEAAHGSGSQGQNSAAGRMRTAGRRLSLQISSKLGGRNSTEGVSGDGSVAVAGPGAKLRRNSKHTSLSGISKKSIGHPEGFRHEQHVGFPGVVSRENRVKVDDMPKWC